MSYRDIRNFYEMLRALGYPNVLSMESFRHPNFPQVADLAVWLAKRFDPEIELPFDIENEEGRVTLIKNVANFMVTKANIKLNTKRLYQADGYAVKELLKVASLLYEALQVTTLDGKDGGTERSSISFKDFDISDRAHEVKQARQLASEITASAANLFDLLGKESDLRIARQISMNRQYEPSEVENSITKAIEAVSAEIDETQRQINNISTTEANLDSKIERRKVEIDRYEKRLQTLNKVRPAFLEEFNALETELEQLFVQYSSRIRCLNYLEKLTIDAERVKAARQELAATEKMTEKMPLDIIHSNDLLDVDDELTEPEPEEEEDEEQQPEIKHERPRAGTGFRSKEQKNEILGMIDSETDSDELLLDGDDSELPASDDDTLAFELSPVERRPPPPSGRKTGVPVVHNSSDDDF
ncbi:clusterin-associated protein 1 [Agrilus planipennis]|uniref:Clusterin-associated protein 1 n=1 Tax=Agrilus planipennis TaxID=224129 RepID=A0A7F5R8K1_AGRPL|nr:clusterin-associated protein 1 [Agrilus planipennis]